MTTSQFNTFARQYVSAINATIAYCEHPRDGLSHEKREAAFQAYTDQELAAREALLRAAEMYQKAKR